MKTSVKLWPIWAHHHDGLRERLRPATRDRRPGNLRKPLDHLRSGELANGWYYSLTPQQVEMFDGRSYEGGGIHLDVVVKNDREEVHAGVDRVLQSAIELLR